jgi:hypothetical protein
MPKFSRYIGRKIGHCAFGLGEIKQVDVIENESVYVYIEFGRDQKVKKPKCFNAETLSNPRYFDQDNDFVKALRDLGNASKPKLYRSKDNDTLCCAICGENLIPAIGLVRRHFLEKHNEQISEGEVARILSNGTTYSTSYIGDYMSDYVPSWRGGAPGLGKRK